MGPVGSLSPPGGENLLSPLRAPSGSPQSEAWRRERVRVTASFDRVADVYRRRFEDELAGKPFDRDLLDRIVGWVSPAHPVLEVGAGPGQVAAYLAVRGVRMVVSDASWGQLTEARALDRSPPLVAADLAGLPVGAGSLGGIVGFYCLIYGPAEHLDPVFADWHRALEPGGVAAIAVHAGHGEIHADRWEGRSVDMTVVLRDPDDVARRLRRSGFVVHEQAVRPPYTDENTDRCYIVATRGSR